MQVSKTFSDVGVSGVLSVKKGESFTYTADLSVGFDGALELRRTRDAGQTYDTVATITADVSSATVYEAEGQYSFRCSLGAGHETLTGTAAVTLADAAEVVQSFKDNHDTPVFNIVEGGVQMPGTMAVTGNATMAGDATVDGVSNLNGGARSTSGAGVKNGATVSVVEKGEGTIHQTVLTLASTPISIVSVTTGNGVGGTKVYDFPVGRVLMLGCMADLAVSIAAGKQADFTDATPEGDFGIGSAAPANADALGTDATDDDMATATAFTMDAYAATAKCPSESSLQFDGTTTALDMYVNALVDAADIDDDVTTEILVSGTITCTWINLGDF